MDTGAEISVIKIGTIQNKSLINQSHVTTIRGVTSGNIKTFGTLEETIFIQNAQITHTFHVVPDNFNVPSDAILGKDFLFTNKCIVDYNEMTLSIPMVDDFVKISIKTGPEKNTIIIPPRSEVLRKFNMHGYMTSQFVDTQEIAEGVFIAKSIIHSKNPYIRVLNTTSEIKVIKNPKVTSQDLDNFEIISLKPQTNPDRDEKLVEIIRKNTPTLYHDKLLNLCQEFKDVFAIKGDPLTQNNFYEQTLRLTEHTPVCVKNYRLPQYQKEEINTQVSQLLEHDLIEPSMSNYNSPLILVPKKSVDDKKTWRMCVDYSLLNKKLIADKFPLPRIDDILDSLGRAKYFSILDLFSGFHQIPLNIASREITAFSTDRGSFQWKVLPFGLNVAPNSFMRMMNIAFSGLPPEQAFLYMDDLIVIGCSEQHHLNNLKNVFQTCQKYNLKLNPIKCQFFKHEVTFLGHKCTENGLLPDDSKLRALHKYPIPIDKDAVRRFVAFCNYFRRFIPNFAGTAQCLNKLTRKEVEFIWTDCCQHAFESLKSCLSNPPILQYPDFKKEFIITVDASKVACGAVLAQLHGNIELPISYNSKTFTRGEQNKPTIVQELLAIYYAIKAFRPYIFGVNFRVKSDHKPLIYLFKLKDPSSKLTRIRLELEEYNFTVEHIRGKENVVADALSRISIDDLKNLKEEVDIFAMTTRSKTRKMTNENKNITENNTNTSTNDKKPHVIDDYGDLFSRKIPKLTLIMSTNDLYLRAFKNKKKILELNVFDAIVNEKLSLEILLSKLETMANNLSIKSFQLSNDDQLFKYFTINKFKDTAEKTLKNLNIILTKAPITIKDEKQKLDLITKFHDDEILGGHFGSKKVYSKLRQKYYWKNMTRDIAKFTKNCKKCKLNKVKPSNIEQLTLTETPQNAFDVVIIDTIGPMSRSLSNNTYAVTIMCDLTKYLVTIAIPNKESKTIARAIFDYFILIYGAPKQIRTDRGTEYINSTLKELCDLMKIDHTTSTAYRHQTLGTIERSHRFLNEYLRAYLNESFDEWDMYLKYFTFCYNISSHTALDNKFSPYELIFTRNFNYPPDIINDDNKIDPVYNLDVYANEVKFKIQNAHVMAREILIKTKSRIKEIYDKKSKPLDVKIGDKVKLQNEPYDKFKAIYSGPFIIQKIIDKNVEILNTDNNTTKLVHKNRIRPY